MEPMILFFNRAHTLLLDLEWQISSPASFRSFHTGMTEMTTLTEFEESVSFDADDPDFAPSSRGVVRARRFTDVEHDVSEGKQISSRDAFRLRPRDHRFQPAVSFYLAAAFNLRLVRFAAATATKRNFAVENVIGDVIRYRRSFEFRAFSALESRGAPFTREANPIVLLAVSFSKIARRHPED